MTTRRPRSNGVAPATLADLVESVREIRDAQMDMRSNMATKDDLKALLPRETYDAYHRGLVETGKANAEDIRDLRLRHDRLQEQFQQSQLGQLGALGDVRQSTQQQVYRQRLSIDDRTLQWFFMALIAVLAIVGPHLWH